MRSALLAALVLSAPAFAQDAVTVRPGDASLVTSWIQPATTSYTIRVVEPIQQNVGTAVESVAVDDGVVTRVLTVDVPMQGMSQKDSVRADLATLAPLTHHSTGGMAEVSLEFMPEGVVGAVTPKGQALQAVTEMTDAPVFDSAWIADLVQSLPLAEGYAAEVPAFNAAPTGLQTYAIRVTGRESRKRADGTDGTGWVVEAQAGPATITYVVDTETRELLAQRFSPQPGVTVEIVRK